ncbi:uncharacterized protein BX664DRAFT_321940 [Halteromyces radiatus]|uniref:uncharacterized protein n=1 Tax=Halteromyces radiatus TaxID=101107 RepID=UPI00221EBADE|nr:uncharacterized protein BX664DRAFT_321940 [Halteromyces radiatus]KAI8099709.1 hypothetical protein BX664DRAFT_321940 [Halteromyces radiatus]
MTSLASLISNVKTNTANNSLLQKNMTISRKRANKEEVTSQTKKPKLSTSSTSNNATTKKATKTNKDPKVVVFDGSSLTKRPTLESKAAKKAFLAGKANISDLNTTTSDTVTKEDVEDDIENNKKDKELQELLATSKLLEEYQMEEMTSKERRKHMLGKLDTLGLKPASSEKRSLSMYIGMESKKKERQQQKLQEAKDTGLYDKSLKHLYVSTKKKERKRDPGITNGIGRMKGAVLTISKQELGRIQRQGTKPRAGGKKRK